LTGVILTSDITATLLNHAGSDLTIAQAAWVSLGNVEQRDENRVAGLLNYLMKHRHGSPFEQGWLQFRLHIPIFVARELVRHRIGVSINEMSGRYTELEPIFWVPRPERGLVNTGTSARPAMEQGETPEYHHHLVGVCQGVSYRHAWDSYKTMIGEGIANEVARTVLPVAIYTRMHVTFNPRSLMHFLSLRVNDTRNTFATYPMAEIEELALQMEDAFFRHWPLVAEAFVKNGRGSP